MHSPTYTRGFMDKLAELNKSAKQSVYAKEIDDYMKERDRKDGIKKVKPYVQTDSLKGNIKNTISRAGDYLGSLGRGLAAAGGVTALRAGENAFTLATWAPELLDSIILGKILGVDEGRGALGRAIGNIHRKIDSKVHDVRSWSDDYDYVNRIPGRLNKFLHGTVSDSLGGFVG